MSPEATLLVSALFSMASAALYATVGRTTGARAVSPEHRLAAQLFSGWWYALAATTTVGATTSALAAAGVRDLTVYLVATYLSLILITVGLWGLLYYLLYLFTGRRGVLLPVTAFYVLYMAALFAFVTAGHPSSVAVEAWRSRIVYEREITGWPLLVVVALLVLPQILSALAYFSLCLHVRDATQRYRIVVVSWSIILWFGAAFVASVAGYANSTGWQVGSRFVGLAAAAAVYLAYRPPPIIARRLGVRPLGAGGAV